MVVLFPAMLPTPVPSSSEISIEDWALVQAFTEDDAARIIQRNVKRARANLLHAQHAPRNTPGKFACVGPTVLMTVAAMAVVSISSSMHANVTVAPLLFLAPPPPPPPEPMRLLPAPPKRIAVHALLSLTPENGTDASLELLRWAAAIVALGLIWLASWADGSSPLKTDVVEFPSQDSAEEEVVLPRAPPPTVFRTPPTTKPLRSVAREATTQTSVRTNSAGRPIDMHGRFLSFHDAKEMGWIDQRHKIQPARRLPAAKKPPPVVGVTWNEFQKLTAGRGLSRTEVSHMWQAHKKKVAIASLPEKTATAI